MNWLIILLLLVLVRTILLVAFSLPDREAINAFREYHFIAHVLLLMALFYYYQAIMNETPSYFGSTVVGIFAGSFSTLYAMGLTGRLTHNFIDLWFQQYTLIKNEGAINVALWEIPAELLQLYVSIIIIQAAYGMYRKSTSSKMRISNLGLMVAFGIFSFSAILETAEWIIGRTFSQSIIIIPGILIFVMIFVYNPSYVYASPVRIYQLTIYNELGIPLLEISIDKNTMNHSKSLLLGSSTSLLNTVLRETTTTRGRIAQTNLTSVSLIMENYHDTIAILEVDSSTWVLKQALKSYLRDFYSNFASSFQTSHTSDMGVYEFFRYEIGKYFPFIDPYVLAS